MKLALPAALCLAGALAASAGMPLDDLVAEALDNNPELAAARKTWEAAGQRVGQARSWEDPMIGADVERGNTDLGDYNDVEYMASQKLPWFGQRGSRSRAATFDAESLGFRYLEKMRATRADAIAAAWDLWLADRRIEVSKIIASLMADFEAISRARYESGSGMQSDVLRASIESARMSNEAANMERERSVALAMLNTVMGVPSTTPREAPQLDTPPPDPLTLEQHLDRASQLCCILQAVDRKVKARMELVKASKLERRPMLEVRVEGRQFKDGGGGIDEVDTGLFLNFPWLWKGKYDAMTAEAGAELAMAQRDQENEVNMTRRDVHESHTMAENAERTFKLYDDSVVPQSRQLVDATRAAYQAGSVGLLELIDAQKVLQDALLTKYETEAAWAKARARLDQITGPYGKPEIATGLVSEENNP